MFSKDQLRSIMEENLEIEPGVEYALFGSVPIRQPKKPMKYFDIRKLKLEEKPPTNTIISVINCDTAKAAYDLLEIKTPGSDEKYNPMILNFASDKRPGGGCYNGSMAQEESLFYRSLYHLSLPQNMYPLKAFEAIYSPDVAFIRDLEYKIIPPKYISCLAIPAIRHPQFPDHTNTKQIYSAADRETMTAKIEAVFKIAAEYKHDALVLGAFGCGVFRNPPEEVANIFDGAIKKYGGHFKKIVFAILDRSPKRATSPEDLNRSPKRATSPEDLNRSGKNIEAFEKLKKSEVNKSS